MKPRQKTLNKIVSGSLRLFNSHGVSNVSTNHIAEHIEISPGNLYYYFPNKEAIIRAIFAQIKSQVETLWQAEPANPLLIVQDYVRVIFSVIFGYRFFFIELPLLLRKDPVLKAAYTTFQLRFIDELSSVLLNLTQLGIFKSLQDDAMRLAVANNIWIVAIYWHCHQETRLATEQELGEHDLLKQIFCLLGPYVEDQHYQVVKQFFNDFVIAMKPLS